jgi:threonylcarbamoyladenosine tRNA methylthiotransferase MtaB
LAKRVAIQTFGCKINQYESSCIINEFKENGFEKVDFSEKADVYIINTCTVTNRTDFKARNAIRKISKIKEENRDVKLIVTGCYAQRAEKELKKNQAIDFIVDNNNKSKIYRIINGENYHFDDVLNAKNFDEFSTEVMEEHSRAFLKIQDGCDFYCTYCAIPYARGHSRSRNPQKIIAQISELIQNGYKEIVLSGINLGLYGNDLEDDINLAKLLYQMEKIEGLELIRLSSVEPQLFTDELLDFFKNSKKLCHHFHIPLQSGSDTILKAMKRHYLTAEFQSQIEKIKNIYPDSAFGIDVITGFPGETNELFEETFSFLEKLDFTHLHVFTYSPKIGTPAALMKNQIKNSLKKERTNRLLNLSEIKKLRFSETLIRKNQILSGIVEEKSDGYWTLLSDHFVRVYFKSDENLKRELVVLNPKESFLDGVLAELR